MFRTATEVNVMDEYHVQKIDEELSRCTSSPNDRIRAQCIRCLYDPREKGTLLEQISACTRPVCPLFTHRPRTEGATGANRKPEQRDHASWKDDKCFQRYDEAIEAKVKKGTPVAAIVGHCIECCFDPGAPGNGSWRQQVNLCNDRECSFWSLR
jgi:hypothetical protein